MSLEGSTLRASPPFLVHGSTRNIPPRWIHDPWTSRAWREERGRGGGDNVSSDWPVRSLASVRARATRRCVERRRQEVEGGDKKGVTRIGGRGARRAGDRRGTSGSSDAHRARTAFQLAASRCRGRVVLSPVFASVSDRNRFPPSLFFFPRPDRDPRQSHRFASHATEIPDRG